MPPPAQPEEREEPPAPKIRVPRFSPEDSARWRPIAAALYRLLRDCPEGSMDRQDAYRAVIEAVPGTTPNDVLHAIYWMRARGVRLVVARPRSAPEIGWSRLALAEKLPESWDSLL